VRHRYADIYTYAHQVAYSIDTKIMRSEREHALIQETQAIWQERYQCLISEEEAKEIISNARQLFTLLDEWDRK
jgi:hypothetical protein